MVTELSSDTIFDELSQQIFDTFNELIKQLTDRRDQLLSDVAARKVEFEERIRSQKENLRQLEKIHVQIENINIANLVQGPIQKQITDLKQAPNLKFECQIKEMSEQISLLGTITPNEEPVTIDYEKKMRANHILEVTAPSHLHVDDSELYVIDSNNSIIHIFDVTDWSFKNTIQIEGKPSAIVSSSHHLYTAFQHGKSGVNCINQLNKKGLQLIKTSEIFPSKSAYSVISLAISSDEIFIVGSNSNNKIFVFDLNLHYRREFGKLENPRCIRFNQDRLYVLDAKYSLHMFNIPGQHLGLAYEFLKPNIWDYRTIGRQPPHFVESFCFDQFENALFVSTKEPRIWTITPAGKKIFEIGKEHQNKEDVGRCSSVAVFRDKILVAYVNWDCVKIF